jgi:hypothetical protein
MMVLACLAGDVIANEVAAHVVSSMTWERRWPETVCTPKMRFCIKIFFEIASNFIGVWSC